MPELVPTARAAPVAAGELALERGDLGAVDEDAGVEHARDRGVDLAADGGELGGHVEQRDAHAGRS